MDQQLLLALVFAVAVVGFFAATILIDIQLIKAAAQARGWNDVRVSLDWTSLFTVSS